MFKGWKDNTGTMVDFNALDLDLNSQNEFNFYAVFEKVNLTNPSVELPTTPGERANVVSPTTPGSGGNQTPSSPKASQQSKLAQLGEQNSMIMQKFGLLMAISGIALFLWKRI
ncbi:hypothetical protein AQ443_13740 [Listeria monocytogenes]|nr:hypothetical protein [Listeria monocytogenes]EAG1723514.1 hypothetical protein [Listeria monocytogenes]